MNLWSLGKKPYSPIYRFTHVCHPAAVPQCHSVRANVSVWLAIHSALSVLSCGPSQLICSGSPRPRKGDRQASEQVFLPVRTDMLTECCGNAEKWCQDYWGGYAEDETFVEGSLTREEQWGTSTHTHRHVTCVLDMSAVAIPALQVSPDFIQEDFPNPNNIPLKVTPVQIFIAQIISSPSFPSFTKR